MHFPYQILRIQLKLQTALSGTDIDIRKPQARFMDIGREGFFMPMVNTHPGYSQSEVKVP